MGATFLSERRRLCQQRETLTASGASARDGSKHHRVPASPRQHWLRSRLTTRGDGYDLYARSASGTRCRKRRSYCGTVPYLAVVPLTLHTRDVRRTSYSLESATEGFLRRDESSVAERPGRRVSRERMPRASFLPSHLVAAAGSLRKAQGKSDQREPRKRQMSSCCNGAGSAAD